MVWQDNPRFFYIGMQDQFYTFNMFDAQAWYVRDIILGRIKLPKADAMKKDWKKWLKREEKLENAEQMIWFQGDYVKELIEATDYPTFDIEGVNKTFMVWEHHKMDDIMGFRNNAYKSLMTGTRAPSITPRGRTPSTTRSRRTWRSSKAGYIAGIIAGPEGPAILFSPHGPFCRHPGESRGPASGINPAESWIPACAGMTALRARCRTPHPNPTHLRRA